MHQRRDQVIKFGRDLKLTRLNGVGRLLKLVEPELRVQGRRRHGDRLQSFDAERAVAPRPPRRGSAKTLRPLRREKVIEQEFGRCAPRVWNAGQEPMGSYAAMIGSARQRDRSLPGKDDIEEEIALVN